MKMLIKIILILSQDIKHKLKELNLGYLITPINKRNTKDINILKIYKDTNKINKYKKLLKKRYNIEFTNNKFKQYKRINVRYDKYSIHFINYIYLVMINLVFKGLY